MTQTLTPVSSWDSVIIPVGGEARTIASLETGFQALLNRTQYLFDDGCLNGVDGGTYDPTAAIIIKGTGVKLQIGDAADATQLRVKAAATLTCEAGSFAYLNGTIDHAGATQTLSKKLQSQTTGRVVMRRVVMADANTDYGIEDGDVFTISATGISADRAYTLNTTGAVAGDIVTFRNLHGTWQATIAGKVHKWATGVVFRTQWIFNGTSWELLDQVEAP
jgi:hypothetical protein